MRAKLDDPDKSPAGSSTEMRGIPVRVQLGLNDIEAEVRTCST